MRRQKPLARRPPHRREHTRIPYPAPGELPQDHAGARLTGSWRGTCLPGHGLNYTLPPPLARTKSFWRTCFVTAFFCSGSPASRPEGLERVLVRGGFQVTETPSVSPPDFIVYTPDADARNLADEVRALATQSTYGGAPVFVLLTQGPAEA